MNLTAKSLISCLGLACFSLSSWAKVRPAPVPTSNWKYVERKLAHNGFNPDFIVTLKKSYEANHFAEVLELNTLLFLRKSDYHGIQVTEEATTSVRTFMDANQQALKQAEEKYNVSREVISSLLWLESRFGQNLGRFHVASVFLTLLQADRPEVVRHLHRAGKRFTPKVTAQNRRDITLRTKRRVKWALSELKAIEKMYAQDPKLLTDLRGSFAGAFGMSQFIPSSYVAYAKAHVENSVADLTKSADAIQSVAYYLYKNGWKLDRPKSYVRALMHYNNSQDYANAILKLAARTGFAVDKPKRTPARKK